MEDGGAGVESISKSGDKGKTVGDIAKMPIPRPQRRIKIVVMRQQQDQKPQQTDHLLSVLPQLVIISSIILRTITKCTIL